MKKWRNPAGFRRLQRLYAINGTRATTPPSLRGGHPKIAGGRERGGIARAFFRGVKTLVRKAGFPRSGGEQPEKKGVGGNDKFVVLLPSQMHQRDYWESRGVTVYERILLIGDTWEDFDATE